MVCPDGQCTSEFGQSSEPATEVFKQAATSLAVANEIAKHFDPEHLSVFTGEAKSCRKSALGFADCCKDSGWGTDMGLAQCSEEEKALGLLKQASRVHYVGHYCSKDSMAGCLRKRDVYCAYPSKLSRIVVDQGKTQLGQHYGSSKHPDCRGFTLNELESLNFDAMDLSEFYAEVMMTAENGATPESSGVAPAIQHQLESRFPELERGRAMRRSVRCGVRAFRHLGPPHSGGCPGGAGSTRARLSMGTTAIGASGKLLR